MANPTTSETGREGERGTGHQTDCRTRLTQALVNFSQWTANLPQPRPQGAFAWLWGRGPKATEKRPGDEVVETVKTSKGKKGGKKRQPPPKKKGNN